MWDSRAGRPLIVSGVMLESESESLLSVDGGGTGEAGRRGVFV